MQAHAEGDGGMDKQDPLDYRAPAVMLEVGW